MQVNSHLDLVLFHIICKWHYIDYLRNVLLTGGGDPWLYWKAVRGCRTGQEAAQCHPSCTQPWWKWVPPISTQFYPKYCPMASMKKHSHSFQCGLKMKILPLEYSCFSYCMWHFISETFRHTVKKKSANLMFYLPHISL